MAKESRLYIYPDEAGLVIYLVDIGTKESQQDNISSARSTSFTAKCSSIS